jgi:hypothetical protein
MAKKPTPAAAGNAAAGDGALRKTFKLAVPVRDDAGHVWSEITVVEPELLHRVHVQRQKTATRAEQTARLIAALSGVPEPVVRRMKTRDAHTISHWIDDVVESGARADALAEMASGEERRHETSRSFQLLAPVLTADRPVTEVTVVEPDLEAGIAVEKMDLEAEKTAALIAICAGVTIPVVMRMKLRDIVRIERWMDFFFNAGEASPAETDQDSDNQVPVGAT